MNNEHTPEPGRSDIEKELISMYDQAIEQRDALAAACRRSLNHYEKIRGESEDDTPLMACLRAALAKLG